MWCFNSYLAALLLCSVGISSQSILKRQSIHELEHEPLQEKNDYMLKFALLCRSSGKYVTMLKNGSVFASSLPVQGSLDSSSLWYLHMTRDVYRLENVQSRDHYLAMAHRNNITVLVAHNLNEPFTLEMMMDIERRNSENEAMQNNTQNSEINFSEISRSTFTFYVVWKIRSVDIVTSNVMLVRNDTECYLSFNHDGYPHKNLCPRPSVRNNLGIVFEPIF